MAGHHKRCVPDRRELSLGRGSPQHRGLSDDGAMRPDSTHDGTGEKESKPPSFEVPGAFHFQDISISREDDQA